MSIDVPGLFLLFTEILKYKKRCLHPRFFTLSQTLRTLFCLYFLFDLAQYYQGPYPDHDYVPLYKAVAPTLAHCIGISYGSWVWWQQRKLGLADFNGQSQLRRLNQELMLPSSVNQAVNIRSKGHMIASIVHVSRLGTSTASTGTVPYLVSRRIC